jgi:hypothetical protein
MLAAQTQTVVAMSHIPFTSDMQGCFEYFPYSVQVGQYNYRFLI